MGDTMREEFDEACKEHGWHGTREALEAWEIAHERGRQLGMDQAHALHELSKSSREIEAMRVPLSELRINQIAAANEVFQYHPGAILEFVRDIEAAHSIPTPPAGDSDTQS